MSPIDHDTNLAVSFAFGVRPISSTIRSNWRTSRAARQELQAQLQDLRGLLQQAFLDCPERPPAEPTGIEVDEETSGS